MKSKEIRVLLERQLDRLDHLSEATDSPRALSGMTEQMLAVANALQDVGQAEQALEELHDLVIELYTLSGNLETELTEKTGSVSWLTKNASELHEQIEKALTLVRAARGE